MHCIDAIVCSLALTALIDSEPTSSDEMNRQMNILRNKDHFKKSDAELQLMRDELKKQQQHKKETMVKENNERDDKRRELESKTFHGSEYLRCSLFIFSNSNFCLGPIKLWLILLWLDHTLHKMEDPIASIPTKMAS